MKPHFNNVLVATDFSPMDEKLLTFVRQLSNQVIVKRLHLAHIIPSILIPANTDENIQKLFVDAYPLDEKIEDVLMGQADPLFANSSVEVDVLVREGRTYPKLVELIEQLDIDLLVVGQKNESSGSGITAKRIARKVDCHVLFVPEELPDQLDNVLVPVDFSKDSAKAMHMAIELATEDATINALNVIQIPRSDTYYGMSLQPAYWDVLKEAAWRSFDDFQVKYGLYDDRMQKDVVDNYHNNIAACIQDFQKERPVDLIVLGAQGHTAFEKFLFGSVTESLINLLPNKPILIIR